MIEVSTHKRDDSLDFIKVLATIAVLKLHVGWQGYAEYAGSIVQYMCGCAVPLFFMVSGGLALNRSLESTRGGVLPKESKEYSRFNFDLGRDLLFV